MGSRHSVSVVVLFPFREWSFCYVLSIVYIGASVQKMLCVFTGFMMSGIRNEFLASVDSPSEFLHLLYQPVDEFPRQFYINSVH